MIYFKLDSPLDITPYAIKFVDQAARFVDGLSKDEFLTFIDWACFKYEVKYGLLLITGLQDTGGYIKLKVV